MDSSRPTRILFVCLGNICRSPSAEAVMVKLINDQSCAESIEVDSAGVGSWHVGEPADARMRRHAEKRGYQLDGRARQVRTQDFEYYDWIIAMDDKNFDDLQMMDRKKRHRAKIHRMSSFCSQTDTPEVPDPYYGGADGFETVLSILEDACNGLLEQLLESQPQ